MDACTNNVDYMAPNRSSRSKYNYTEKTLISGSKCPHCGNMFKPQGYKRHESTCKMRDAQENENFIREYDRDQRMAARRLARRGAAALTAVAGPSRTVEDDPGSPAPGQAAPTIASPSSDARNVMDFDPGDQGVPSPVLSDASMANNVLPQSVPVEQPCEFKTEFHPRSGRETLYQSFEEFGVTPETQTLPAEEEPWRPFQSRGDFEFSEIALDAALNKDQVDRLLSLMARISQGQAQITLKNEADLRKALDNAAVSEKS